MSIKILMTAIFLVAVIFFLGFIAQMCYLIVTPSDKLSIEDFGKKNLLFKYFKKIKIKPYTTRYPKLCSFLITPLIEYSCNNYPGINEKELIIGWLFWNISFKYTTYNLKNE